MNRISAIALLAAATFATVHSTSAQSLVTKANVPFAFTVKGTTLPAGTYLVNSLTPNLMQIESLDTKHPIAVTILTRDSSASNSGSRRPSWFLKPMEANTSCMRSSAR